jgi:hypothetical protein
LAHYSADNTSHPLINHAVALVFPKLRAKYGETVTYEENPRAHIATEFGFDITQTARHRYTTDQYHDFIGFQVSKPVLERAFLKTYGLPLDAVLGHEGLAVGTFRRAVSEVIPAITRAALTAYHPETVKERPNLNKDLFLYNLSRARYEAEWGREYRRPKLLTRVLGFILRRLPKVGSLKALAFKLPTPQTEDLYLKSVNQTVNNYRKLLRDVSEGNLRFPDLNCDTGKPTREGEYALTDQTYDRLLEALVKSGLTKVEPGLRANILAFYANRTPPEGKNRRAWQRTAEGLQALKAGPNSPIAIEVRKRLLAPPFKLQSPRAAEK